MTDQRSALIEATMLKQGNRHAPIHLLLDDTRYFITGAIYQKRPLLRQPEVKTAFIELMTTLFQRYQWILADWVVLDNHYHLLGQSRRGVDLPRLMRHLHSAAALHIRQLTDCAKPVWWNYWDYCPRSQQEWLVRANYALFNPVKHGYVQRLQEYPFSSFHQTYAAFGRASLVAQFQQYPEYKTLVLREAYDDDF